MLARYISHLILTFQNIFFQKFQNVFFFLDFFFFFYFHIFEFFFLFVFHSFLGKTARSHGPRAARWTNGAIFLQETGGEYVKKKCPNRGKENGK